MREWRYPGERHVAFFQLRGIAEKSIVRDSYRQLWRTFRAADRGRAWLADEDIQRYVDAMARPGAVTAALSYYRQLLRGGAVALSPARVIAAPALLLWGELDPLSWPLDGRRPGALGAQPARPPLCDGRSLAQPAAARAGQRRTARVFGEW